MHSPHLALFHGNTASRHARVFSSALLLFLVFALFSGLSEPSLPASTLAGPATADADGLAAPAVKPFVYATVSSNSTYDIMLSSGAGADRRIARVKVDSVFFANLTAQLSANGSLASFRVSGDRYGGSRLYTVDVKSGTYVQIASIANSAEGIGAFAWSPAGNTLAFVRSSPAPDVPAVDDAFGTIYIYSDGFKAVKLGGSTGHDHLLGFSRDGLGVYASRLDSIGTATLQDLVYLPLSGGPGQVILRSRPDLSFAQFAVFSVAGQPERVAFLVEGNFTQGPSGGVSVAPGSGKPVPPKSEVGRLARPASLGIAISDIAGTLPVLVRRDAEAFPTLVWSSSGKALLAGGTRSGASWEFSPSGQRTPSGASLTGMDVVAWSVDGNEAVLGDTPTTHLVSLDVTHSQTVATRWVGGVPRSVGAALRLPVPYIQQVNDTSTNGDGNWACGPTTLAMALAYFGKLEPWQDQMAGEQVARPNGSTPAPTATPTPPRPLTAADFAPYITNKFTVNGHTYDAVAADPRGNMLAGLYGTICPTGLASWPAMVSVLEWNGLGSQFIPITWDSVVGALRRGHPVALGNMLTSEGHILLVIGYTNDGNLVVNDPYGNRFAPGYGANIGSGLLYPWKLITPRRALEIIGTVPTPTPTATRTPLPTRTPTVTGTASPTSTSTVTPTATQTSISVGTSTGTPLPQP